jgi:CubicO group peptidase (beta-lactamase class C family)
MRTYPTISRFVVPTCLLLALPSTDAAAQDAPPPRLLVDREPSAVAADLDARIPALMKQARVPGLSIAIVHDGRVVWHGAFGVKSTETGALVSTETLFEAASLTKPLFAYAVMRLVEEGVLNLDTPLVQYLPPEHVDTFLTHPLDRAGFRRDWFERVTGRHVLSHSSGLPHGEPIDPHYPLFFEPGARFKYSAAGYLLLQRTVEHLTGKPLEQIAREYVFDPLGMTQSSMIWRDEFETTAAHGHDLLGNPQSFRKYRRAHAAASMYTTAVDYARFVGAVLNGEGLQRDAVAAMLTPEIEIDEHNTWSLGFGVQRDGNGDAFWQWGDYGIFRNFAIAYREPKIGVVYLTNSFNGLSIAGEIVSYAIGGALHAMDFLGYEPYDTPTAQFTSAVVEDGAEAAIARLPELRASDPEVAGENVVNSLGYALLNADRFDDAIRLFELNVAEHPRSANTYDSLAEGFMTRDAEGDIERAIRYYRKALAAIPNDPRPDTEFLERLRVGGEQRIQELEARLEQR